MHAWSVFRLLFLYLAGFVFVLPVRAQSVTPVTDSTMLFSDPAYGVSFRFPAGWSFARIAADARGNAPDLSIAYRDDRSVFTGLRGLVANETLHGIPSWPKTVFSSVEFAYDARPAASAAVCRQLAGEDWKTEVDPVTLSGVVFWHGTSRNADVSTEIDEEIYAAFVPASSACLRFDLAVATSHVTGKRIPRELMPKEKAVIQASLDAILRSVQIASPVRPMEK